jgi:glycosyltransferase involved in cell wall biosynthesis
LQDPTVSFVVPCYKLAHFLVDCVESILSQSYKNIEVIIMDDESPDNTEEVAHSIIDSHPKRAVSYIRNTQNLGNINNYNKGIGLASGTYVWIISPDDRLRSRHIVDRYVRLMEADPNVGYTFCAGHLIENDHDLGVHEPSQYRKESQILDGPKFVKDIVAHNFDLLAPSVMIRKECYERITLFPVELPHRGDTYVWAMIAMKYKVGYFSEAMVDYRVHSDSMTAKLSRENAAKIIEDCIAVIWWIRFVAEEQKFSQIIEQCGRSIIACYRHAMSSRWNCRGYYFTLTVNEFELSLSKWEPNPSVRSRIRATIAAELYWVGIAQLCLGYITNAHKSLRASLEINPKLRYFPPVWLLPKIPSVSKRVASVFGDAAASYLERW